MEDEDRVDLDVCPHGVTSADDCGLCEDEEDDFDDDDDDFDDDDDDDFDEEPEECTDG